MIKNKMTATNYLDLNNEDQYKNEVFLTLDDSGDWEYPRVGFGEDHVGLYLVDLDDTGEVLREKTYINPTFSVGDVLAEGVACNVFEKYEDGDGRGTHGVRVDAAVGSWDAFVARVAA